MLSSCLVPRLSGTPMFLSHFMSSLIPHPSPRLESLSQVSGGILVRMINAGQWNKKCKNLSGLTQGLFLIHSAVQCGSCGPLGQLLFKFEDPGCFHLVATQFGACDFQGHQRIGKED